jgi:uncharacterized protein YpiB (UPF0302 family)
MSPHNSREVLIQNSQQFVKWFLQHMKLIKKSFVTLL